MKYLPAAAFGFVLLLTGTPAFAQMSMGGAGGAPGGGKGPQPRAHVPDIAPPALPGAGALPPLATGPVMHKPLTGDPTIALFNAVNSGDYNAAQDAVSRGANMSAQNPLGETPLDLAVALNRSTITFMLLAARNETGGNDPNAGPAPSSVTTPRNTHHKLHITPATDTSVIRNSTPHRTTMPPMQNNPGTPNPSAGFLGFGPKS